MIDQALIENLKEIIGSKTSFLLIGHEKPDGDSVGSLLAFGGMLRSLGKSVKLVMKDPIPEVFSFLSGVESIESDFKEGQFDAICLLDNGDARRTGFLDLFPTFKDIPIINIDHHPRNDLWKVASVNIIIENVSSTCEILFEIAKRLGIELNSETATALLLGFYGDTGGFRHANTSQNVLEVTSELLKHGGKLKKISENISGSKSISALRLWGIALNRLVFNSNLGISYSILQQEDIATAGASEDEVSGLVNLLNSAPESRVAILLYETEDGKLRGSLRTEDDKTDLSLLARHLGGGGHKKAAGFTINGKLENRDGKWNVS